MNIDEQIKEMDNRKAEAIRCIAIAKAIGKLSNISVKQYDGQSGMTSGTTAMVIGESQRLPQVDGKHEDSRLAFLNLISDVNKVIGKIVDEHVGAWERRAEEAIAGPPRPVVNVQAPAGVTVNVQQS